MEFKKNIFLTNEDGEKVNYTVLFTFDSKITNKSYVIYTDFSRDDNSYINVFYSSYTKGMNSKLEPVTTREEVELINDILLTLEKELKYKFSRNNI